MDVGRYAYKSIGLHRSRFAHKTEAVLRTRSESIRAALKSFRFAREDAMFWRIRLITTDSKYTWNILLDFGLFFRIQTDTREWFNMFDISYGTR